MSNCNFCTNTCKPFWRLVLNSLIFLKESSVGKVHIVQLDGVSQTLWVGPWFFMLWSQTYLLKLFILTEKDIEMLQNINSLVEEEVSMNIKMMKSLCRSAALLSIVQWLNSCLSLH